MEKRISPAVLLLTLSICGVLLIGAAILLYMNGSNTPPAASPATSHSAAPVQALDQSAEERAYEAMRKVPLRQDTAEPSEDPDRSAPALARPSPQSPNRGKQGTEHAALPPTTLALNCERLRKAYSNDELKNIPGFQEKCAR